MIPAVALFRLTSADPSSRTGALVGLDVFPDELPESPPEKAVTYQIISGPRTYNQDRQDGVTRFRVQFDSYAPTVSAVNEINEAIRKDLSGWKGIVPSSPPVCVQGCFVDNEGDSALPGLEQAGPRTKRKTLDVFICIREG